MQLIYGFDGFDLIWLSGSGIFDNAGASVLSLTQASDVSADISIGGYIVLMILLRFAAYLLFALFTMSVSELTRKTMTAAAASAVCVFAPYILSRFTRLPFYADVSAFISANRFLLSSNASPFDAAPAVFVVLLTLSAAYWRFCKITVNKKRRTVNSD